MKSVYLRIRQSLARNDAVQPVDVILVLAGKMERKRTELALADVVICPSAMVSASLPVVSGNWKMKRT